MRNLVPEPARDDLIADGRPFLSIDYTEFKPETYKAVVIQIGDKVTRFDSGDSIKDYQDAQNFLRDENWRISLFSSTFDNFVYDGGKLKDA